MIKIKPFSFGVTGMASIELPAKHSEFDAKMGYGYGASAYIKERFKSSELKANIGFQNIEQNTNLTKQKQLDLYLMLNYSFGLKSE